MYEQPSAQDRKVRQFSLSAAFVADFAGKQPNWGPVGYFTYKRCVDVSTPVLCDDLQWRPAGELKVGQGIVGFDAEAPSRHGKRHYRLGQVLHNRVEKALTMGIELSDGTVLYATPDHAWLVKLNGDNNRLYWRETKALGRTLKGGSVWLSRPFGPMWQPGLSYADGFLSAAFDGEGCLDQCNGLSFTQTDNPMLARVEQYLNDAGIPFTKSPKSTNIGRKPMFVLNLYGRKNIFSLLGRLRPPRLLKQFVEHMTHGGGALRCTEDDYVKVVRVFDAGERDIAVLSTSTETHFTGGFASHNTYARPTCDCDDPRSCGHPSEEFWESCRRVVEGVYNIQKAHCRRLSLPWNEPKAQQSAQEMFQRMWEFKWTPPGRGLWMMGTPFMLQKGGACINNCFASETEIITADGTRLIGDWVGTTQRLLTRDGAWVDAPIRSFGKQRLYKLWLTRQGVDKVVYCTGDHRWFACDRRNAYRNGGHVEFKTTELRPEVHRLQYIFGRNALKGNTNPSPFGIAQGFTFGDGTTVCEDRHANRVTLCGEKDAVMAPYFSMCPRRNLDEGIVFDAIPNFFRERPSLRENTSFLLGWLMGYFAADGSVSNGQVVLSSANRGNVEFARDVCVVLGIGTYNIGEDNRTSNLTGRPHTMWRMSLMRDTLEESFFLIPAHRQSFAENGGEEIPPRYWTVKHVEATDRVEEVFCATVEGQGAFALSGNILTGNCAFVSSEHIDEDFAGPFTFLMDMSMLGVGVGGDTRGSGKVRIQTPRMGDNFPVADSREGWVALAKTVLNSFVGKGSFPALIDFSAVRPQGKRIRGFGGTASGPGPLCKLMKNIARTLAPPGANVVFEESFNQETGEVLHLQTFFGGEGKPYKITSSGITDIFNMVGACVVAGGVRRSAEIMFGQPDDLEFRTLKDPSTLRPLDKQMAKLQADLSLTVDPVEVARLQAEITDLEEQINAHPLRSHRWASNNSILGEVGMDYTEVAQSIAQNGEPGILWLKNAQEYSRMKDLPDHKDRRAQGANPCFAGDTLIAVADGRGAIPIRQLVEEGNDVPVYSINPAGQVEIKMARRPRMTRESSPLVEIELDDGTSFKVTPDHKMRLLDGTKCEAQDLQPGDSLPRFTKRAETVKKGGPKYLRVYCNTLDSTKDKVFEHRLVAQYHNPEQWAGLYSDAKQSGWIKGGLVVHHKDYNPLNNSPENLEIMTFQDHAALHGSADNAGEKNPMWGKTHSNQTRQKIGCKTVERCSDPVFLAKLAASHQAAERAEASERLTERRRQELLDYYKEQEARTDLDTVWMGGRLHAVKTCETCQDEFIVPWRVRGQCYCSRACMNKADSHIQARKAGQAVTFADKQRQTLHEQVRVFKDLEGTSGRTPMRKEWEAQCRTEGVPTRFRKAGTTDNPHVLFGFGHLQQVAVDYNHRVVAVRHLDVGEPVFNLSVEDNHTVGVVTTFDATTKACGGVFAFQCVEQTLESFELCTLVETYPAHHDSYEDFQRTLKFAYLYAKTVTLIPTHDPRTNAVMNRNRRIGCSMSGIRQAVGKFGRREFLNWCDKGYNYLHDLDRVYSEWLGIPHSIKTTSVKPSGTVSLLCGATPGIHPPHSPFYIRNIRVSEHSPLCQAARDAGYKVEKDAYADATFVISFPVRTDCDKGKRDVSIWEQVALAADMQRHWADNQVSVTVTFAPAEAKEIATVLEVFEDRLKSISFLPLGDDHGYVQAPYIEITEDEYHAMAAHVRPMVMDVVKVEQEDKFCDGGACQIDFSKT